MRTALSLTLALSLSGCNLPALLTQAPPPAVQQAAQIARGPIDFALHSFDASLYAFDMAMDLGHPKPGSPEAKKIAAFGRKVLAALAVADAAQKAGSAASYAEAFANANTAFDSFRSLLGVPEASVASFGRVNLTPLDRNIILASAEGTSHVGL